MLTLNEDINKMTIGKKYLAVVGLTMIDDEERLLLISLNDKVTKKESQIVLKK